MYRAFSFARLRLAYLFCFRAVFFVAFFAERSLASRNFFCRALAFTPSGPAHHFFLAMDRADACSTVFLVAFVLLLAGGVRSAQDSPPV